MNRAVDAYLAELEARRFSQSRRHHSARTLERLLLYLREAQGITDWRGVNETHLRDFVVYAATRHLTPKGKPISAATLRQWLSIIRCFFAWQCTHGHLLHNPSQRLAFPRKEQSLPHVLNQSEIDRLIETPNTETAIGIRDRALMETLYATGIRHAEAHRLDLYDLDAAAQRLTCAWAKDAAIGSRHSPKPPLTGSHATSRPPVRNWPLASGGVKGDGVASRPSFHQPRLCGSPSPAAVSPIK
jgi:site-specific recombinase XerD